MLARADLTFFLELPKNFREIGSVFPSSHALALKMVEAISPEHSPLRILEVGPGSGPMTRAILEKMGPQDSLTICEINSELLKKLKTSLQFNRHFKRHQERVTFFEGPAQELGDAAAKNQYDIVVCSLPFMNFSPELVDELMALFHRLLAPGGTFTNFEYVVLPLLNRYLSSKQNRERVKEIQAVLEKWRLKAADSGSLSSRITLLNLPPARTYSLSFEHSSEGIKSSHAALATS